MTEESLVLGRPPRPPRGGGRRGGRWAGRGPGIAAAVVLAGLTGWAVWKGLSDDGPAAPPRPPSAATTARPPASAPPAPPPAVPYLRTGTLVRPSASAVGLPDASWTDFALLSDGRLVLVQQESLTVLGHEPPRSYLLSGDAPDGISVRADGTAVAWTGPDGELRRLSAGDARPTVLRAARQLTPSCRGIATGGTELPGWTTCDRDGRLLSPGGTWAARIGQVSVALVPRTDTTPGATAAFLGVVDDAVWEDHDHLLVVVRVGDEAHLLRVASDGSVRDVIAPVRGADPTRPPLVLPATGSARGMQP